MVGIVEGGSEVRGAEMDEVMSFATGVDEPDLAFICFSVIVLNLIDIDTGVLSFFLSLTTGAGAGTGGRGRVGLPGTDSVKSNSSTRSISLTNSSNVVPLFTAV